VVSVVVGRGVRAGRAGLHSKLETALARATARAQLVTAVVAGCILVVGVVRLLNNYSVIY